MKRTYIDQFIKRYQLPYPKVIRTAYYVLVFVSFLVILTWIFYHFQWSWTWYGAILGMMFGLIIGMLILIKVPSKVQAAGFGAVAGVGTDFAITRLSSDTATTAINSLASFISNSVDVVDTAARTTGVLDPEKLPLTVGMWVFVIVVGLMMLLGSIME
ncbi:MAG TPA: hypothetical protein VKA68_04545 [bacterium]|nr:hypothetical protein [bacterium]